VLDLSNNHLKDITGMIIGKIISVHAGRRDEFKWAEEIRGDSLQNLLINLIFRCS
jgi:centrosomal protein CEP78